MSSCGVQQHDRREGNGGSRGKVLFLGFVFQRQQLKGFSQSKGAAAVVRSQPWTGSGSRKRQAVSAVAVGGCRLYLFLFEGQ